MLRITALVLLFMLVPWIHAKKSSEPNYEKWPQLERGTLVLEKHPEALDAFIQDGYVNLDYLRKICHFLTDNDITIYDGKAFPKRKKAFVRHIKHINEVLELAYREKKKVGKSELELFYELWWFSEALKQKTINNASKTATLSTKLDILLNTTRSKRLLQFRLDKISESDVISDPKTSPFWHPAPREIAASERFKHLAKLKKIKAKKQMVVLFDALSLDGSAAKVDVLDLDLDNEWSLKWGDEVHSDVLGSHIFAALGYDVDHPYFYGKDELTLIFSEAGSVKSADELLVQLNRIYKIDIKPFISSQGLVNEQMATKVTDLRPFIGQQYVRFKKCAMEARPDRVKRIGPFLIDEIAKEQQRALRGVLLAHQFIGNWDTRQENTLLTNVHMGDYRYRCSAIFSDLGTSFGVCINSVKGDFKVGLVNAFEWEVVLKQKDCVKLQQPMNALPDCYKNSNYADLRWMANKIALLDGATLRSMIDEARWPKPLAELYFHKLASRRASIIKAFDLQDPFPIEFNKQLTLVENGVVVVNNGRLMVDFERENNPESFFRQKGRMRNYGN